MIRTIVIIIVIAITAVLGYAAMQPDMFAVERFATHNSVDFTLEPNGAATNVTWAMHGANAYVAKVMGLFMNMDKMIGGQFETGLAALKSAAEK